MLVIQVKSYHARARMGVQTTSKPLEKLIHFEMRALILSESIREKIVSSTEIISNKLVCYHYTGLANRAIVIIVVAHFARADEHGYGSGGDNDEGEGCSGHNGDGSRGRSAGGSLTNRADDWWRWRWQQRTTQGSCPRLPPLWHWPCRGSFFSYVYSGVHLADLDHLTLLPGACADNEHSKNTATTTIRMELPQGQCFKLSTSKIVCASLAQMMCVW